MQQVYSDDILSRSVVFRWHHVFHKGETVWRMMCILVVPQTVQTECKIEEVAMLVCANCSQLVDNLTAAVGVSPGKCYKILTDDLNMLHVIQHSVPHILMQD